MEELALLEHQLVEEFKQLDSDMEAMSDNSLFNKSFRRLLKLLLDIELCRLST